VRISVDRQRCEGHGLCEDVAPDLFRIDDDGDLIATYDDQDIPLDQQERARGAVRVCPISALLVVESE